MGEYRNEVENLHQYIKHFQEELQLNHKRTLEAEQRASEAERHVMEARAHAQEVECQATMANQRDSAILERAALQLADAMKRAEEAERRAAGAASGSRVDGNHQYSARVEEGNKGVHETSEREEMSQVEACVRHDDGESDGGEVRISGNSG